MRWSERPSISEAKSILEAVCALPTHEFWPDDIDYSHLPEKGIRGHRQITDAYLAALAAAHDGLLATMDEALAALQPSAVLI
jgi:predicted nucleic acid-binding protein